METGSVSIGHDHLASKTNFTVDEKRLFAPATECTTQTTEEFQSSCVFMGRPHGCPRLLGADFFFQVLTIELSLSWGVGRRNGFIHSLGYLYDSKWFVIGSLIKSLFDLKFSSIKAEAPSSTTSRLETKREEAYLPL